MRTTKQPNLDRPDEDNPEWTREDLVKARPAADAPPALVGEDAARALLRPGRGRPPKGTRKVNQTLRLDPDVLEAFRQEGRGWQTRINRVLRENMPKR